MRYIDEIIKNPRIAATERTFDGFSGTIAMPTWRGSIVCSFGGGWEHVSIAPYLSRVMPTWDDMCLLKDIVWNEDEAVIQVHPAKKDYVDNKHNCLHLWRCTYMDMVLPPSCFVGMRQGQTIQELNNEIKAAYEAAGEGF